MIHLRYLVGIDAIDQILLFLVDILGCLDPNHLEKSQNISELLFIIYLLGFSLLKSPISVTEMAAGAYSLKLMPPPPTWKPNLWYPLENLSSPPSLARI